MDSTRNITFTYHFSDDLSKTTSGVFEGSFGAKSSAFASGRARQFEEPTQSLEILKPHLTTATMMVSNVIFEYFSRRVFEALKIEFLFSERPLHWF